MTMLLAAGSIYDRVLTTSVIASSPDAKSWDLPINRIAPFTDRQPINGIAYDNGVFVVVSAAGLTATSTDLMSWHRQPLFDGYFAAMTVAGANSLFATAGWQRYLVDSGPYVAGDEIAQILTSPDGKWPWLMVWTSSYNSIIYKIRYFDSDNLWIAVGQQLGRPLVVTSTDNCATWTDHAIPLEFAGQAFYDVTHSHSAYYFSALGSVFHNNISFGVGSWASSPDLLVDGTAAALHGIDANPLGHLVAVSSKKIWYSQDRTNWYTVDLSGYDPRCVLYHNNVWVVSGDSLLTQYTYWLSHDGQHWTPHNNGIKAAALLAIP